MTTASHQMWSGHDDTRRAAAETASSEALRRRWEYGPDYAVAEGAAKNPLCPPDLLRACARYENARADVARHPSCPADLIEDLIADPSIHWALGERWEPEILRRLSLRHIARNPACPEDLIRSAADSFPGCVAANPSCPVDLLHSLAYHEWSIVRGAVAGNIACPPELQRLLARDRDIMVLWDFAWRKHLADPEALRIVWQRVRSGYDMWQSRLRTTLLVRRDCPPDVLADAVQSKDYGVRCSVARNPACPPELIARLAYDKNPEVREAVLAHPACPAEMRAARDLAEVLP